MNKVKIAVIGAGWRAQFYLRLAVAMPEQFEVVGWVTRQERDEFLAVPRYGSVADLLSNVAPDFAITAVSWDADPELVIELVQAGIPVLSETPPAADEAGLRALWEAVGNSDFVQVAEQYPLLPMHAARLAVVDSGVIGEVGSVQVSSTHGYHAVALMRAFLGADFEPVTVSAKSFVAPLADPLDRAGWKKDQAAKPAATVIATIDFADGKSGVYDFTDNQWHNQLRHRRLLVRGSLGEVMDDKVTRLIAPDAITTSELQRYQQGHDLNLDGHDTEHVSFDGQVVYRNPFVGLRLMDEEIAIASLMVQMSNWVSGNGSAPYPLAQACQDHLVALAIDKSIETGAPVETTKGPWAG